MCFDCNAFQYQLNQNNEYKDHVFQVSVSPARNLQSEIDLLLYTDDFLEQEAQGHVVYR